MSSDVRELSARAIIETRFLRTGVKGRVKEGLRLVQISWVCDNQNVGKRVLNDAKTKQKQTQN